MCPASRSTIQFAHNYFLLLCLQLLHDTFPRSARDQAGSNYIDSLKHAIRWTVTKPPTPEVESIRRACSNTCFCFFLFPYRVILIELLRARCQGGMETVHISRATICCDYCYNYVRATGSHVSQYIVCSLHGIAYDYYHACLPLLSWSSYTQSPHIQQIQTYISSISVMIMSKRYYGLRWCSSVTCHVRRVYICTYVYTRTTYTCYVQSMTYITRQFRPRQFTRSCESGAKRIARHRLSRVCATPDAGIVSYGQMARKSFVVFLLIYVQTQLQTMSAHSAGHMKRRGST